MKKDIKFYRGIFSYLIKDLTRLLSQKGSMISDERRRRYEQNVRDNKTVLRRLVILERRKSSELEILDVEEELRKVDIPMSLYLVRGDAYIGELSNEEQP